MNEINEPLIEAVYSVGDRVQRWSSGSVDTVISRRYNPPTTSLSKKRNDGYWVYQVRHGFHEDADRWFEESLLEPVETL